MLNLHALGLPRVGWSQSEIHCVFLAGVWIALLLLSLNLQTPLFVGVVQEQSGPLFPRERLWSTPLGRSPGKKWHAQMSQMSPHSTPAAAERLSLTFRIARLWN